MRNKVLIFYNIFLGKYFSESKQFGSVEPQVSVIT